MNRESRLINKDFLDDPNEILLAGSNEEFDLLMEWDRQELVVLIQQLDEEREMYRKSRQELVKIIKDFASK